MENSLSRVQESLLALELQRLYDVFDGDDDAQQRYAAANLFAQYLLERWREERVFLQNTALPLVVFHMFETARGGQQDSEPSSEDFLDVPLAYALSRVSEMVSDERCKAFFMHHIAAEFRVFATVLGQDDTCVATIDTIDLTPSQKVAIFLRICQEEFVAATTKEQAARHLLGLAMYIASPGDIIPLLDDKSQKVRRLATSSLIEMGVEKLQETLDPREMSATVVNMAANIHGSLQEKRFVTFVTDFFTPAVTLDAVCELSVHLDQAGAPSHPIMARVLGRVVGSVLKPSFFRDEPVPTQELDAMSD